MSATVQPTTEALRQKAAEIVAGRDFALDQGRSDDSWLLELIIEIAEWILIPFRWLFEITKGLPEFLRWGIVIGLAVVLILLIVHIGYTLLVAIRGPRRNTDREKASRRAGIDPADLERLAALASQESNFVAAIRLLFRAAVVRLELSEKRTNRPGTTNREVLRRYQEKPVFRDPLEQMAELIDRKWYGDEHCSDLDFMRCQSAHREICAAITEYDHAVSA